MWWMSSPGVGWVEDTNCKAPLIIQMLKGAIEVNKLLLLNYYYYYHLWSVIVDGAVQYS